MIAMQFSRCSPPTEPLFSRHTNSATAALPLIPRRAASASRSRSAPPSPPSITLVSTPTPVKVIIQQSTPPAASESFFTTSPLSLSDSDSSSSSSDATRPTMSTKRSRTRAARPAVWPPEQSTPTPAVYNARIVDEQSKKSSEDEDSTPRQLTRPMLYNPTIPLRVQTEGLKVRNFSESHARASSESPALVSVASTSSSSTQPPLIRKKSGQLVKSSLKPSKSLSAITGRGMPSKSEPATPTHAKVVHFDAQLEHVKLFLAEQKPLAVSRDGSPTDDTSGTDSDFPSFIFGDSDEAKPRKNIIMKIHNMPTEVNKKSDVALEELALSAQGTNILGHIRVRNIAYAKSVTVRFTFDSWQTTSEVAGKWVESIDKNFDRFSFSIRLNDVLARIEGKRLYLAVRYAVSGKEFWDNNAGQNYFASFTRASPTQKLAKDDGDIARLKSKLESVVDKKQPGAFSVLPPLVPTSGVVPRFKDASWTPLPRLRTQTYPATPTPNSVPWPPKAKIEDIPIPDHSPQLGSPRDIDEELPFSAACLPDDLQDDDEMSVRNHRRGYFGEMLSMDPMTVQVKRTVPGMPYTFAQTDGPPPTTRFHSFTPAEGSRLVPPYGLGINPSLYPDSSGGSDISTPSFTSPSSSSTPSTVSSPSESVIEYAMGLGFRKDAPISPGTNYRHFLNKFCFFTGSERPCLLDVPQGPIPRTQSASDIEEFLSTTPPKLRPSDSFYSTTPSRSPSFDDINAMASRSGSTTPTMHFISASTSFQTIVSSSPTTLPELRSATPIAT